MKPFLPLAALCAAALPAAPAFADTQMPFESGEVVLPISGLVLNVPRDAKHDFKLSGSWSLDDSTAYYDGRDVVDEFSRASGDLVRGDWIMSGYFSAGGCEAVLGTVELDGAWTGTLRKWSADWQIRGGDFDLGESLGKRPAVALCRERGDGNALLFYYFLVDFPAGTAKDATLAQLPDKGVLAAASAAYDGKRFRNNHPTSLEYVRDRGTTPAARHVVLTRSPFEFDVPDDGQVWLVESGETTEFLTRMAPAMPDFAVEIIAVRQNDCTTAMSQMPADNADPAPAPLTGVPSGWIVGPATKGDDPQYILCAAKGDDLVLAGIYPGHGKSDVSDAAPLLQSLAQGSFR